MAVGSQGKLESRPEGGVSQGDSMFASNDLPSCSELGLEREQSEWESRHHCFAHFPAQLTSLRLCVLQGVSLGRTPTRSLASLVH